MFLQPVQKSNKRGGRVLITETKTVKIPRNKPNKNVYNLY